MVHRVKRLCLNSVEMSKPVEFLEIRVLQSAQRERLLGDG